jgi:hypothetical protein
MLLEERSFYLHAPSRLLRSQIQTNPRTTGARPGTASGTDAQGCATVGTKCDPVPAQSLEQQQNTAVAARGARCASPVLHSVKSQEALEIQPLTMSSSSQMRWTTTHQQTTNKRTAK